MAESVDVLNHTADPLTAEEEEAIAFHANDIAARGATSYGSASVIAAPSAGEPSEPPLATLSVTPSCVKVDFEGHSTLLHVYAGLQKSDLARFASDPFWVRLRWVLAIVSGVVWLAMIAAVVVIIVVAPKCPPAAPPMDWWKTAVVYQVYPRSFSDSDNDGVGDLKGLASRLPYLKDLGVTAILLHSIYQFFNRELDHVVVNHKDIDAQYGTFDDFKQLVDAAHHLGLKLIVDFVPNHTGRSHAWFQESRKDDRNPYSDYYIWHPGHGAGGDRAPPNNWLSVEGGSAWQYDDSRAKYYYHHFSSDQPDLNLENPAVGAELDAVLIFWLDKGVDGFYVNDAEHLTEVTDVTQDEPVALDASTKSNAYDRLNHTLTAFQPLSHELIIRWRYLLDEYARNDARAMSRRYPRLLIAQVHGSPDRTVAFASYENVSAAQLATNMGLLGLQRGCEALCVHGLVSGWMERAQAVRVWPNWQIGNVDASRVVMRMGGAEGGGAPYVNALNMLLLTLPGTPFSYYGEELGMHDIDARALGLDVERSSVDYERYPQRSPMQWTDKGVEGFAQLSADKTPSGGEEDYHKNHIVHAQLAHGAGKTNVKVYTELTTLRRQPSFQFGDFRPGVDNNVFFHVRQAPGHPGFLIALNLGPTASTVNFTTSAPGIVVPRAATVAATTGRFSGAPGRGEEYTVGAGVSMDRVYLRPTEGVVFRWEAV